MKSKFIFLLIGLIALGLGAACASTPTPAPAPTPAPPPIQTVFVVATPLPPSPTPIPPPAFNFPKGAVWTYQGVVKWGDENAKVQQKTLIWKMRIADRIEHGNGIVGYVMSGHPIDLAFYAADKKPGDFLYIAQANRVYQITLIDHAPIDRLKNKSDALTDLLADDHLVYDFPLSPNKKFGTAQFVADPSGMNAWVVSDNKPTTLTGVPGITPADATEFTLSFKTNPDWQNVYFVPNVGITRFVYHHNGTVSEVDVKLIEYAAGNATGACELILSKTATAYTRPSPQATVFGKINPGDQFPVGAMTADGWIGFEPGVAQAANVGLFRLRWALKSDTVTLHGACAPVPIVPNLPPTVCFQMFMEDTKVYSTANISSTVFVTAKADDYAQALAVNAKWLELDLNVGTLKQNSKGWIERANANFNGACDKLPAVK